MILDTTVEKYYIDDNAYPFSLEDYPVIDPESGIDMRETYELDHTLLVWFYKRLREYLKQDVVDLEFHKFNIDGEELTEKQCVDRMMSDIMTYLYDFTDFISEEEFLALGDEELNDKVKKQNNDKIFAARDFGKVLGEVLPVLWW